MKYLVNSQEMKQFDKNTIEYYKVPSMILMERAALATFWCMKEHISKEDIILIICGVGNNGGDGFALARLLHLADYQVSVFLAMDENKMTPETKMQYETVKQYKIPIITGNYPEHVTVIADALFGIGLSREIKGELKELLQWCNKQRAFRIALDIPSGVSADNGNVLGEAFRADITVTYGFAKVGLMLFPGNAYCGQIYVEDIGIDKRSMLEDIPKIRCIEQSDLAEKLPERRADSNKGTYGKVLIVAGNEDMAGAAYFSAKAAFYCGVGLVQIYTASCNRDILLTRLPEAIISTYSDMPDEELLKKKIDWADVVLIGPGIGMSDAARKMLSVVFSYRELPVVVDADALNLLSKEKEWVKKARKNVIFTPHLGEMSRLNGQMISSIKSQICKVAEEFAKTYQITLVLKDARTVVTDGKEMYLNTSGCHGMAVAGSGDVLAGMITGLLAQRMTPIEAAAYAVYLHGMAGETAASKKGSASMVASDLLEAIPEQIKTEAERMKYHGRRL